MNNKTPVVLVVDDEKSIRDTLAGVISDEGWACEVAESGYEALKIFKKKLPDVVLLDVWMKGMDGIETLQKMKDINNKTPVIIMSGHGTIDTAVRVTKLGAHDFLEKPLSLEKLLPMIEEAFKQSQEEVVESVFDLTGESEAMTAIKRQVKVIAPRNSWVLITGENGTGKEVLAQNIHNLSSRRDKAFVAVNCAAIPEDLIESELFGHKKGAFTSAVSDKRGRFEMADHGTLFLDEIGDMSLKTQAKILRILQEQRFEMLGGVKTISVDVRVIAATNKNLQEEIAKRNFREDLYYRLNVIPIEMPTLRSRAEDIHLFVDEFLGAIAKELQENVKTMSESAMEAMKAYAWPGNVRELRNTIERLCIMTKGSVIERDDLPEAIKGGSQQAISGVAEFGGETSLKEARLQFERKFLLDKLEENEWNVSKTAEKIGIERSNLHRKLKSYNIDPKNEKGGDNNE